MARRRLPFILLLATALLVVYLGIALWHAYGFRLNRPSFEGGWSFVTLVGVIVVIWTLPKVGPRALTITLIASSLLATAWAAFVQTTPVSDFLTFQEQAVYLASTHDLATLWESKSFTTVSVYAIFYWLLGPSAPIGWLIGISLHVLQAFLVYKVGIAIPLKTTTATRAAMMYALLPALITYSPVIKSEGVFLAMALSAMWVLLRWRQERHGWLLVVGGSLLGLTFLTRGVGVAFVMGGIAYVVVAAHNHQRPSLIRGFGWRALGLFSLGVGLVLAVQLALNVNYGDTWSVSGTDIAPLTLMFGTNRETRGGFSRPDLERIGWNESETPTERRRALDEARGVAYDRIRAEGFGFIGFATGPKMARLWEQEGTITRWSIKEDRTQALDRPTVDLLVDAAYVALLSLSTVGAGIVLYRGAKNRPAVEKTATVMIVVSVLALGVLHVLFEVQARYHLAFWPTLAIFAAIAVDTARSGGTALRRRFGS